ncbi:uncharacterized protein [Dysidea avara]|uniref:uncharacterized protein n=1 Tax=Dysidea avara TaxID=196820 RepID=UPI0033320104
MMELENAPKWNCYTCSRDLSLSTSVACESCLNWYHLNCVGLTSAPKKAVWFCRLCYGVQARMNNTDTEIAHSPLEDKQQPTVQSPLENKQQPTVQSPPEDKQQPTVQSPLEDKQQLTVQPPLQDKQQSNYCPKVHRRKRRKVILSSLKDKQQPTVQSPLQEKQQPTAQSPLEDKQQSKHCPEVHHRKRRKVNNRNRCQHDVIERFTRLIGSIKQGDKLDDDHINAASQLLRDQFPDLQGLSTPAIGECFKFEKFDWMIGYAGFAYCQVLHTGCDHWVAIKAVSDNEVYVYDSIFTEPTYHVLKQIAAICNTRSAQIKVHLEKVQMQVSPDDCGVYAIAFLTDLCFGRNPASHLYDHKKIRSHLINCFEADKITPFPCTKTKEKRAMLKKLNVYCQCRLPNVSEHMSRKPFAEEVPCMVKCYICDNLYHHTCVNITIKQAKKINSEKEMWFCNYKECEEYFGYLFDSDSE